MVTLWKTWLLAARPKTLPAAIVPVWSGCLMSITLGFEVSYHFAILTLLGAIFIQIATNFFNDVIDAAKGADTTERVGPTRATSSGLLSPKAPRFSMRSSSPECAWVARYRNWNSISLLELRIHRRASPFSLPWARRSFCNLIFWIYRSDGHDLYSNRPLAMARFCARAPNRMPLRGSHSG